MTTLKNSSSIYLGLKQVMALVIIAFAVWIGTAPPVWGQPPCSLSYTFDGEAADDQLGRSVSGAGDVNNDGYDDLIIGAWHSDAGGTDAGRAYVFSGLDGDTLYVFTGEAAEDRFGISVSGAGDVNNDGYDDLIVGAHWNDAAGSQSGRAYVFSGIDGDTLHIFTGEAAEDCFGWSVSGAGDVNNDGYDDLFVGAPISDAGGSAAGRAYVFSGIDGDTLYIFTGQAEIDVLGSSVSGAGDVNDDGYDDLIVGAPNNDAGGYNAGRAYVFSGLNGDTLHIFTGEAAEDCFGWSVSGAGDVNNDGYADLIVGAFTNDAGGTDAGRAYVYSGQTGALLWTFAGQPGDAIYRESVSGAGDVNGDGYDDLIVGAYLNDAGGSSAGEAYVYCGRTGTRLCTFTGEAAWDHLGISVSGAGDLNNDGYDDLIVGASANDAGGTNAGRAYVYCGRTGDPLCLIGEVAEDDFGYSVSGAGDVNNDGYDDLIVGADENDIGGTDAGRAYVYCGQTCALLWTFTGESQYDYFGYSVSGAGDVNNDGYDDLIVGAPLNDAVGTYAGRAYVYSGQTGALVWTFTAEAGADHFGISVSGAGDVNNDGYDDLIVGAHGNSAGGTGAGRAYVYSGQTGGLLWTFTGEAEGDHFGYSVSGAGDVNDDGYDDLIVGANYNDAGGAGAGRAYVYSGQTGGLLWTFTGEAEGDHFGTSVSGAGEVNNDGFPDLIVGASLNDAGGTDAGRAYVYSGQTGGLLHTFTGEADSDHFGRSVSGAGDVNNDGHDDLIVGAYKSDSAGTDAGRAYIYSGRSGAKLCTFDGEAAEDWFGYSVSGAGDVNSDGFDEVIVGAPENDAGGTGAGRAYVYGCQVEEPYTCGDCNEDTVVNIADVSYLINYLFIGGPAPDPLCIGDVNCDTPVNIADASYLINYLFIGGPQPCSECCDLKAKMEEFPGQKTERD